MNDFEHRFRRSVRNKLPLLVGIAIWGCSWLAAGLLRADPPFLDPIPAAVSAARGPIWVSPISSYDPAEGTAGAHAVQIDAGPHDGYVQTSAYAQTTPDSGPYVGPSPTPAPAAGPQQLPPGGYLWGGSPSTPGPAGSYPSAGYTVAGSMPPPESVGPPAAGNLMGGLGLGVSAPIGVPPLGPLISDRPILLMPSISPDAIHTVFRLHQSITDEVGDDGPITSLGGFFPHTTDKGIWFFDGQFNLLEDANNPGQQTENFGANLGLGWRWIAPSVDAIAGLSFWYDVDRTRPDFVHQAAVSGELLGDLWQIRVNGYFPAGTNRISSYTPLGAPMYVGENIDFPQTRFDNLSMGGMDFEIGRRLPGWLGDNGVSAYVGSYYYRADAAFNTFGVMTRLEALVSPNLTIDAKFSNDPLFHNKIGIGITYLLPNGKCKSCAAETCSEVYRLTEPVVRNRTVVYGTQTLNAPQVAINPATGTPIIVVHVDSSAPAGGNGTVNMPYNNLPAAQAGSAPNDIILVQGGSTFSGQGITLQNSQRFLGEGIPHTVATVQAGTITLPMTSLSTLTPVIANSPGDTVTLANGNEVSNFVINNSGGAAIAGNGISGATNINNVAINGGVSGINIQNSSAAVTVTSTPINGAATGISLANNTGSFDFAGTQTVTGSTVNGVVLTGNSSPVTFDNLQLSATSGTGLSATNQTGALTISAGAITAAAGTGVNIDNSAIGTAAPLAITLASVNAVGGTNGINLNNTTGTFTVSGSGTTAGSGGAISDTTGAGVAITGANGTVALNYLNITDPIGDGVDVTNSAAAANVTLTGTQIALAGTQTGVNVNGNAGALNLNNATVTGGGVGLNVAGSGGTENVANFTSTNAATGISLANNTGAFNATGTTTVTGSTVNGVTINNVTAPVSFATLDITSTGGVGLAMTNSPTTLTITGGTINSTGGDAVDISGNAVLAVTLGSVSDSGGANGINLNTVSGSFIVNGGTLSNLTSGVLLEGFGNVSLNNMTINAPAGNAITAITGTNLTVNGGTIETQTTGTDGIIVDAVIGTTSIANNAITFGNAVAVDLIPNSAGGTYNIENNVMTTTSTTTAHGLFVVDAVTGNNSYDVSGNTIDLGTAASGVGIEFQKSNGVDNLSSSSNNSVSAFIPSSFLNLGGGSFSGTIEVNGSPEP